MEMILASASPRRKELFGRLAKNFKVVTSSVDERAIFEKDPAKFVVLAAEAKAKDVGDKYPDAIVVGADTIVVYRDKVYGKPADREDAVRMLKDLSGKEHKVMTGIAVYNMRSGKMVSNLEVTSVLFKDLTNDDINAYINDVEVMDKAGAYGIQDMGENIIASIRGDYENVVGLPLKLLKKLLSEFKVRLRS